MDGNNQNQQGSWQFVPDEAAAAPYAGTVPARSVAIPPTGADGSITWTASEFIAHQKSAGWFLTLMSVAVAAAGLAFIATRDLITAISILVAAGMLAAFATRQPRELTYRIDERGLQIGSKFHSFDDFRSFDVVAEGAFASIAFTPLKRFAPMLSVYYDPNDEAKIVAVLSEYLPLEHRKADLIDQLMWRIRF